MAQKSSVVALLPPALRKRLDARLAEGRMTLDGLVAMLAEEGFRLSRSAVGRYSQRFKEVSERLRRAREMADALIAEIGPATVDGKAAQLIGELAQSLIFNHMLARDEGGADATPQEFMMLGRAIRDLAIAQKTGTDRELAIIKAAAKKAAETAVAAAGAEAKKAGATLSPEALKRIREEVYGIVEARP